MDELKEQKLLWKVYVRENRLPRFARDYLDSFENLSLSTRYEYIKDIELFLEFLVESEIVKKSVPAFMEPADLATVKEEDILEFLRRLTRYEREYTTRSGKRVVQEFKNGPKGKERKRVVLHNLFRYLIEMGHLKRNPVEKIRIPVDKVSDKPVLTHYDLNRMLEVAYYDNPDEFRAWRNYVILKLLAYTGIRIGELIGMDIDDVWRERDEMMVTRIDGEGDVLLIPPPVRKDLYHYLDMRLKIENIQKGHKNALFLSQQMRRMDPRSVRKMIKKVGERAGVRIPVTPQTFRKSCGKWQYEKTGDVREAAEFLGYRSVQTFRQTVLEEKA